MAKSVRIDSITIDKDGKVTLGITQGTTPLPIAPSPEGRAYTNPEEFIAALAGAEDAMFSNDNLLLLQLAAGYKQDPTLGAAFISRVKGKTATIDLTGVVSPISVQ